MALKLISTLLLTLVMTHGAFSQVLPEVAENKKNKTVEIEEEIYQLMTDNGTLEEVKNSEWLLKDESEWDIIKSIPSDAWELIKAPAGWDKREWFIASGAMTITGLLMASDVAVKDFAQKHRTELTNDISHFAEMASGRTTVPGPGSNLSNWKTRN
jgi:hypothetical protein